MTLRETEPSLVDAGGLTVDEPHARSAADPSASQSPDDDRYRNAGAGIAPIARLEPQEPAGDPTPSDRAIVGAETNLLMLGHDGGPSFSGHRSTSAAVTLSGPALQRLSTDVSAQDRGAAQTMPVSLMTRGGSTPSVPADAALLAKHEPPGQGDGRSAFETPGGPAVADISEPAIQELRPRKVARARGGGRDSAEPQTGSAPAKKTRKADHATSPEAAMPSGGDGPSNTCNPNLDPPVATIVDLWRQRQDLCRAAGRLNLQALATCRRAHDGDKEAAQKAWGRIQKGEDDTALAVVVEPYRQAMACLETSAKAIEKQLAKLTRKLPLWTWAADVRGLGELSLAGIVGEASGNPGDYKSVSALWKRFGLAVIDGERQRRVSSAEQALLHGYAPQRRAFAYVVSCNLMKSQGAEGPYRAVYDQRKAYELEREIPKAQAHNRALRYMIKRMLRDLWAADRRLRAQ